MESNFCLFGYFSLHDSCPYETFFLFSYMPYMVEKLFPLSRIATVRVFTKNLFVFLYSYMVKKLFPLFKNLGALLS